MDDWTLVLPKVKDAILLLEFSVDCKFDIESSANIFVSSCWQAGEISGYGDLGHTP